MPLEHLRLVVRAYGSEIIREMVAGWLTLQGSRQQTKTYPSLPMKKGLPPCPGASIWGAGIRFATHLEAREVLSGSIEWESCLCALPWPCYCSLVLLQKELIHLSEALIFVTVTQGILPYHQIWRPVELRTLVLEELNTLKWLPKDLTYSESETRCWLRSVPLEHW